MIEAPKVNARKYFIMLSIDISNGISLKKKRDFRSQNNFFKAAQTVRNRRKYKVFTENIKKF